MKLIISDIADIVCKADDILTVITDNGNVKPCCGCFGCWAKTPGLCVIRDGYENTGALMAQCDELIIISECTYGGYSPFVKRVLDRAIGYLSPHFVIRGGEMHHKRRYTNRMSINVFFYGDATDAEKTTARNLVQANAVNYDATVDWVEFYSSEAQVREVLA